LLITDLDALVEVDSRVGGNGLRASRLVRLRKDGSRVVRMAALDKNNRGSFDAANCAATRSDYWTGGIRYCSK
jgi:hypothetical protein